MNELTSIQSAWIFYFAGSLGCTIAAWWMFLWAWRFVRYAAVVTVATLLFTPYAIDPQTMTMAPAVYTLVFEGMSGGLAAILPLIKVMLGIWLIGLILATVLVILTRNLGAGKTARDTAKPRTQRGSRRTEYEDTKRQDESRRASSRGLSRAEHQAREELLKGEVPIRAIRD
jgi:hypothetical protein